MNKVITVNLGGNAYQLEESAYDALRAYIKNAESALQENPDKEEIIKDLELAIGSKCANYLSSHKTVITLADMESALLEMGPVEGSTDGAHAEPGSSAGKDSVPKRLFRLPKSGVFFGVASGFAAYLNVDVTLVRILFVLLTIFTGGGVILAYILLAIFIPKAETSTEQAQAYGEMPITAQELVNRAKAGYEDFTNSDEWQNWKQELKNKSKEWRHEWKKHEMKERLYKQRMHRKHWEEYTYKHHRSAVGEIFGIACATLALTFAGWLLYHYVPLFHNFFDALHAAWESFMYSLAQVIDQQ